MAYYKDHAPWGGWEALRVAAALYLPRSGPRLHLLPLSGAPSQLLLCTAASPAGRECNLSCRGALAFKQLFRGLREGSQVPFWFPVDCHILDAAAAAAQGHAGCDDGGAAGAGGAGIQRAALVAAQGRPQGRGACRAPAGPWPGGPHASGDRGPAAGPRHHLNVIQWFCT